MTEPSYKAVDLSAALKVSLRKLQWWDERGIVKPKIWGHTRRYTPGEALAVGVILELRRKGLGLLQIRKLVKLILKLPAQGMTDEWLWATVRNGRFGNTRLRAGSCGIGAFPILELAETRCPVYVVSVAAIRRKLDAAPKTEAEEY
jgi:DNA-binding transcriptional MerR regulator